MNALLYIIFGNIISADGNSVQYFLLFLAKALVLG